MTIGKAFNRETSTETKFQTLQSKQRTRFACSMNIDFITWSGRHYRVITNLIPLLEPLHSFISLLFYTVSKFSTPKKKLLYIETDRQTLATCIKHRRKFDLEKQ